MHGTASAKGRVGSGAARGLQSRDLALERALKNALEGEVRFDAFTRGRYATDASIYQIVPAGVVFPKSVKPTSRRLWRSRAEHGVPVIPRGGGTSQNGQPIGDGLVVDCSRHLNAVVDYDAAAGSDPGCSPGIVLGATQRAAAAATDCSSRSSPRPRAAAPSAAWPATIPAARARCATARWSTTSSRCERDVRRRRAVRARRRRDRRQRLGHGRAT